MIWQIQSKLLNSNNGKLKELCVSFALFKLLRRRFGGHKLYEAGLRKTRDFVLQGLLSTDGNFERAFGIIELELEFLYDLFYTRYAAYFYEGGISLTLNLVQYLLCLGLSIWSLIKTFTNNYHPRANVDVVLTKIILFVVIVLEILQFIVIPFTNWWKVKYVAFYVTHTQKNPCKRLVAVFMLKLSSCVPSISPWGRKINKYSLLHDFCYRSWMTKLTCGIFDKQSYGRSVRSRIKLCNQVKEAIARTLKESNGCLSNGRSSLHRNSLMNELLGWACRLETITHQILVWHIATTLCKFELEVNNVRLDEEASNAKVVATNLSGYCAYLVASVPDLLPENQFATELIYASVISEAHEFLEGCHSMESKYRMMMRFEMSQDETMILMMGAKLGKQLIREIEDRSRRWKVLAEFWAEFILFLAPSNDPFVHAKNMTSGGDFITHLWALLTHAGILDRPPIDEDNV